MLTKRASILVVALAAAAVAAAARPEPAEAYSACTLMSLGSSIAGNCQGDRIFLTGGDLMVGRIGGERASITYLGDSMIGRLGSNRFSYTVLGNSVAGRYGGARFFVTVFSTGNIIGRVGNARISCLLPVSIYFCRGGYVEAIIPVAALLLEDY